MADRPPPAPALERVPAERAEELCHAVLTALGAPSDHAATQARLLVTADLSGRASHGMQRLPTLAARIRAGLLDPAARPQLTWAGTVALSVDGRDGFGPVAVEAALTAIAPAAREHGLALAAIRRSGHAGMLAPYVERLAEDGLVGIALTTSEALVHPAGGRRALVGTNPIGVGVPARPQPFVLDMSTAAISAGEVIAHAERGQALPPDRAVDAEGRMTTDPARALEGAISPFGGSKGYGLGLAFELLVGLLSGTAFGAEVTGTLDAEHPATKGDVIFAIDPRIAGAAVADQLDAYLRELRETPTAPGVEQVLIPGDRMRAERARRSREGIPYPAATWARLLALEADPGGPAAAAGGEAAHA